MEIKNIPVSDVSKKLNADVSATLKNPIASDSVEAQTVNEPTKELVSDKQLAAAIDKINKFLDPSRNSISFTVDKETDITVVKVIDTTDNTVIRQMPTEEALAIARDIDRSQGVLLNTKA